MLNGIPFIHHLIEFQTPYALSVLPVIYGTVRCWNRFFCIVRQTAALSEEQRTIYIQLPKTNEHNWNVFWQKVCVSTTQKDELMSLNSPNGHTTHTISILNAQFVDVLKCVFAILCLECGVIWNEESVFFPKQNLSFQPNHHDVECVMCTHFARSMFHKVEMLRRLSIGTNEHLRMILCLCLCVPVKLNCFFVCIQFEWDIYRALSFFMVSYTLF